MRRVFVDTSAWYELTLPDRPAHAAVTAAMTATCAKFATSTYVIAELVALMTRRVGHAAAAHAVTQIRASADLRIEHPDAAEEARAWRLFLDSPDKTYNLADCLSFVIMRRLGITEAITLDYHFRQEGFTVLP
jgi:predicted nucleic acid-binding protein